MNLDLNFHNKVHLWMNNWCVKFQIFSKLQRMSFGWILKFPTFSSFLPDMSQVPLYDTINIVVFLSAGYYTTVTANLTRTQYCVCRTEWNPPLQAQSQYCTVFCFAISNTSVVPHCFKGLPKSELYSYSKCSVDLLHVWPLLRRVLEALRRYWNQPCDFFLFISFGCGWAVVKVLSEDRALLPEKIRAIQKFSGMFSHQHF